MSAVTKKVGRPSLYIPEIVDELLERQSRGEPLSRICDDDRMPAFWTVFRWEDKYPEFREASSRARAIGTHFMAGDCLTIADNPALEPQDKHVRINTRLRLMGHWNRKDYSERKQVEHTGQLVIENREVLAVDELDYEAREKMREALEAVRASRAVNVTPKDDE